MKFSTFVKKMNKVAKATKNNKKATTKKTTKSSQVTKKVSTSTANITYTQEMKEMQEELDYQNELLVRVNAAQAQYKIDNDLDKVISELEFAFIESNPPCKTSQVWDLVKYYNKAGMYDKSWAFLNNMYLENEKEYKHALNDKVRFEQAKILKKEKKWADAIEKYMLGYLIKCSSVYNDFQEDKFLKDISSSANKLNLDDNARKEITNMLKQRIAQSNFNESELIDEFRKYYNSLS